ncbi:MAG TPA: protein-disulfide reductase DsbD domain-containing protein [Rhizomicrobium sp.]|jgi:thiol:disulfide interchange protein DsbD|nr:protein-disulfide reductase DsbD domain-containing protein [Rhizomicrobium sp.]
MKSLLIALSLLFVTPAFAPALAQAIDEAPKVHARLVAEDLSVPPGGTITVALEENIRDGWHTYWINPGDAGAPSEIKWTLPQGWSAGAIEWPTPKRLPVGPLMDYGYEGKLWLLQKLTVPADAKLGDTVTLKAAVDWLVCKDICVPEETTLTLPLKIGPLSPDPTVAKDFAAARNLLPVASPWKLNYALKKTLDIYVAAPALASARPVEASFFPDKPGIVKGSAPQTMGFTKDGLVLRLQPGDKAAANGPLTGVLVLKSSDGSIQALDVSAPVGPVPQVFGGESSGTAEAGIGVLAAMLFAFIGGLILNVMPCVLPILAMKALALAGQGGGGHEAAKEGFSYSAGAILSFLVFGLVIVLLRQGGAVVGWGFQLQEPIAVAGFALLIFAVGLNLSGVFEVGSVTVGDSLAQRSGATGAFFTGVLAVAVAAPCTAPFMAAALGFALTQSVASAMLIFFALGVGFALPFLILGIWPKALAFLPKPGTWMLRLKQFLAFPMYGAAAWLVWVLAQETGANGVALVLAAFVALALAAWLWTSTRNLQVTGRGIGTAAAIVVFLAGVYGVSLLHAVSATPQPSAATANAEPFTPERLASLRASGKPVFVDATAAWCITCLVNEQAVLSRPDVQAAFNDRHVAYLVADWTNRNDTITKMLSENGRSGVPLYLYFAPGADKPVILPQILTESGVLDAVKS